MTSKKNTQLWLRICEKEQISCAGSFLPAVLALLATAVTLLSFSELTGMDMLCSPFAMLLAGCGTCVTLGVLTFLGKKKWFYPGILILLFLIILLFGKQITHGCALTWNRIGDTWALKTGWVLPRLEAAGAGDTAGGSLAILSILAGIVTAVVCCALAECCLPMLAVLIPGTLLASMTAMDESAEFPYLLTVLFSAILFLLYSGGIIGKKGLRGILGRLLPPVLVGALLLAAAALPGVRNWAESVSDEQLEKLHRKKYETQYTTLPEGDFADFHIEQDTEYPALIVNMETPEPMYLRGFTGAEFDGTRWTALDPAVTAQNKELLYWLNLNAFNPNAQYEKAAFVPDLSRNTVTVQNIGACSRYLYVPYTVCQDSSLQAENLNSGGVQAAGERIYMFSAVSGGPEQAELALEQLETSREEAVLQYRKAESAYREFVYENYLQIPQEVMSLLQPYWDQVAPGSDEEEGTAQAQLCAMEFLEACFPESGAQTEIPLPLGTLAGSSYQYATVAVMTLRYYGIPARYAEGYRITRAMTESVAAGESIDVNNSHAAAWAEVYQDGIGWIPMEMTPGVEKIPQGAGDGEGDGQSSAKIPKEGKELEEPQEQQEQPEPNGGAMVALPQVALWGGLTVLAVLMLLVILVLIRHSLLLKKKHRRFDGEDPKEAVAWLFADTALLLEKLGCRRGNGSMLALTETVCQQFGEIYAKEFESAAQLNGLALFSSREMTEEQRSFAKTFREATLQNLKNKKKWYEKLWIQWFLCLY